jgi:hypothetical protein
MSGPMEADAPEAECAVVTDTPYKNKKNAHT